MEVRTLAAESKAAIVCVTETWFDDSVMDSEIELPGYVVQRKDRERSGGGVCMYIRSDLAFNPRPELSTDQLETLWIEILLPKTKPILVCVSMFNMFSTESCLIHLSDFILKKTGHERVCWHDSFRPPKGF